MKEESVYTEKEWEELERSVEDVRRWKETGKPGSLVVSQRRRLLKRFTPTRIKRMRRKSHLTQEEFAVTLNASVDTIRSWEQDKTHPTGPALKLLDVFEKHPECL